MEAATRGGQDAGVSAGLQARKARPQFLAHTVLDFIQIGSFLGGVIAERVETVFAL